MERVRRLRWWMVFLAILTCMFAAVLFMAFHQGPPSISSLDQLAQAKNVAELTKLLDVQPRKGHNPFSIIQTGGAYGVGRNGWHALPLKGPGPEEYVVISTALTSEDTGELVFQRVGEKLRFVPEANDFGIKLIRHDFDLIFDVPTKRAKLVDKLRLSNSQGLAGTFLFRMCPQYIVSSITNSKNQPVAFQEAGGVVSTIKPDREDTYTIKYGALVNQPDYSGSISETEATLSNDYWYPMVARQPVPYDITIRCPAKWVAVGQGDLIEESVKGTEKISRYKMDMPCVFYSVSAGPFKKFSQKINGRTYSCWSAVMTEDQMKAQTEFYAPIIEFYNRFYPFPFKGYGAIDSAVYGGGALEAYSFTTWGHGALPGEDAHEPAHSWWGGVVNNTYLSSFWNESFAVFADGMFHRGAAIGRAEERKLAFINDGNGNPAYSIIPIAESGAEVGGLGSALGYGKGAQVLQMLEVLLGTERITAAMQAWAKKFHGKASDWADFEKVVSDLNPNLKLKSFFDDWIRKPGYADLKVTDVQIQSNQVMMNVGFNGPTFRIPLEVMLQFADGKRRFAMIDLKKPGKVTIQCGARPVLVSVDPWRRVLRKIAPDESPVSISRLMRTMPRINDAKHPDYLAGQGRQGKDGVGTTDPAGKFIVGHPSTMPLLAKLCEKVGFKVSGNKLTYDGTTIDLNHGAALAVVDLGGGKRCLIGLGKTRVSPGTARARLALTDDLGRFLRGVTEPKTAGNLVFRP